MLLLAGHRFAVIKGGHTNERDFGTHGNYSHLSFPCPEREHWAANFRKRLDYRMPHRFISGRHDASYYFPWHWLLLGAG